jgi:hypothetical protein
MPPIKHLLPALAEQAAELTEPYAALRWRRGAAGADDQRTQGRSSPELRSVRTSLAHAARTRLNIRWASCLADSGSK